MCQLAPWWRYQMETFSASLAIYVGNSPVPGEFPAQRPVRWSFDVCFDVRLNKQLRKQSWGWWFETPLCPLWHHINGHEEIINPPWCQYYHWQPARFNSAISGWNSFSSNDLAVVNLGLNRLPINGKHEVWSHKLFDIFFNVDKSKTKK